MLKLVILAFAFSFSDSLIDSENMLTYKNILDRFLIAFYTHRERREGFDIVTGQPMSEIPLYCKLHT